MEAFIISTFFPSSVHSSAYCLRTCYMQKTCLAPGNQKEKATILPCKTLINRNVMQNSWGNLRRPFMSIFTGFKENEGLYIDVSMSRGQCFDPEQISTLGPCKSRNTLAC